MRLSFRLPHFGEATRWVFYGIAIGIVAGVGASAFFYLLQWAEEFTFGYLAGYVRPVPEGEKDIVSIVFETEFRPLLFFFLPAIGGLISGFLVYTFAPEAEGHGTDAMIDAFHNKRGYIRPRVPYVKAFATIITLATGGSAGREGPIAQIGGGFGSWLAGILKLRPKERRLMLLAGTAGGLGAIFRAPLGGAITAIEVLYREDFESEALVPCIISSVTAHGIFSELFGFKPIFTLPEGGFSFTHLPELAFYALLGLVCVPVGIFYVRFFYGLREIFDRIPLPRIFKPALGGLGVALLYLIFSRPEVYGSGWGQIQKALWGELSLEFMASLVLLKIAATSFTISSGGSGGVFGPTLFIGAMLGGVVGTASHQLFPELVPDPRAFVLVGMAGFFAGCASAPIGSLLMAVEMTGGYGLVAPLMMVSVLAIIFNRRWSIYRMQVRNKFDSPAHLGDFTIDVLREIRVRDAMREDGRVRHIPNTMTLKELRHLLAESDETFFPVFDKEGNLTGLISLAAARVALFEEDLPDVVLVDDIAYEPITIRADNDLHEALTLLLRHHLEALPVVSEDGQKLLGYIFHDDISSAYHAEVVRRRTTGEELPESV